MTADPDMVCSHHQFGTGELLIQFLFWQPYADNRRPVRIKFWCAARTIWSFYVIINANISGDVISMVWSMMNIWVETIK